LRNIYAVQTSSFKSEQYSHCISAEEKYQYMQEFSLNIEHSSDATFNRHWSRIVYLISSNLFVEMGVIFLYNIFSIIHLNNGSGRCKSSS
jgi:hypothetical protein